MKRFFTLLILVCLTNIISGQSVIKGKSDKLSYGFGGFVNLNAILDFNGLDNYDDFTTSQIPINPSPYEDSFRFHMTARQSRLNFIVGYETPWGNLKGFVSGDFYNGNIMSNSFFRLREAYLELGRVLLGQTNTTFGNPNVVPMTVDFEGPNSASTLRNPMIKYTSKVVNGWNYILALEMRGTDIRTFPNTAKPFVTTPSFVANLYKTGEWGTVTLTGMVDITRYFDLDSTARHDIGYGGALSGIINTWGENHFSVFLVGGKGVSDFVSDLNGMNYNGVPDLTENKIVLLNSLGGFIAYTQNWSGTLSSNFIYSYLELEKSKLLNNTDFRYSQYALVNLFYAPFPHVVFGAEYIYGKLVVQDDQNGNAHRLQFLAQFNF